MNPAIEALIARRLAAPKRFRVTTRYANGDIHERDTETRTQAENWAIGMRRKIGRDVISRETGETVRVVDVTIAGI